MNDTLARVAWRSALAAARVPVLRRAMAGRAEKALLARLHSPAATVRNPLAVARDKAALALAVLRMVERAVAEDRLGPRVAGGLERLVYDVLIRKGDAAVKADFRRRNGCGPPDFLTISPGKACNLRCTGCYAAAGPAHEKLAFALLDRLVSDAKSGWGMRFFVLSGGEPFAYRSEGHDLVDLAGRHPDCFFMAYSNGTLVDARLAARLAEVGNLTPALSVEGLGPATDARRGAGVYDRVLAAMGRLRAAKVMYGVSLTATRENVDELLSDEVVDTFFGRQGALYAWVFHYMPIGRSFTLDLMPTPAQRLRLLERVWHLVRDRRLLVADFWNSGTSTNGCIAGGRPGGYLYVNWNGDVSPCVFAPYAPCNLAEVYAAGGGLDDVWRQPFFAAIRDWQRAYGYRENGEPCGRCGNWLAPCLVRDHHDVFESLRLRHAPRPTDGDAAAAVQDPAYHAGLVDFGRRVAELTDPLWERDYLSPAPSAGTVTPAGTIPLPLARSRSTPIL